MRNFKEKEVSLDKLPLVTPESIDETQFQSITKEFLFSSKSREIACPSCGSRLNFKSGLEWIGPDSFTCNVCNRLLSISIIHRALRDLGIEQ